MIRSELHTFHHPDGRIQRVQAVSFARWADLDFLFPVYEKAAFDQVADLFVSFIVKKYALVFGRIVLFTLPEEIRIPFPFEDGKYGKIYDPLTAVKIAFEKGIRLKNGKFIFLSQPCRDFFRMLEERGYLRVAKGKRNTLFFLPVGRECGFLSKSCAEAELKVNASFFLFDRFDCRSVYDHSGMPFGLAAKNGEVLLPPLFGREVLLVSGENEVSVTDLSFRDISVVIGGSEYRHGENCTIHTRPDSRNTPAGGYDIIVCGRNIVAEKEGGLSEVPCAGFVLHLPEKKAELTGRTVSYRCDREILFALQAGNSVIRDGRVTDRFISPFYHSMKPWKTSFPPAMYPLNFKRDRAPRIVLGADGEGRPMLLWFEGAGKFGHDPQTESAGASLSETAEICSKLGMKNGIHLDGGGSAQILINGKRELKISDRDETDFREKERAVPLGLMIR